MNENQRLLMNQSRVELDTTSCKQQLDEYSNKYNEYCKNIMEMQTIIGWKILTPIITHYQHAILIF